MIKALPWENGKLIVSENKRFLCHENGTPFFWLGDTGWLLAARLNREEAEVYLEDRREKGFNVVQVMVLHTLPQTNPYGKTAVTGFDCSSWNCNSKKEYNPDDYDYWDHLEFIIDKAAEKGIYIALVPVWGSIVKKGLLDSKNAETYGYWLAARYRNKPNIIWLNGGDIRGDDHMEVWRILGKSIKESDPDHLMSFHPFGRTQSSTWFHNEDWLDFNMFQSGHRRYDQNKFDEEYQQGDSWKGEDNWRYVLEDYSKEPLKPTIDGEPSYEGIPQGLHNPSEPYWTDNDCRRYAYWSVFAGAFGHTYGHSAVMQMHKPEYGSGSYGVREYWYEAIKSLGSSQMKFLKKLILSVPFFERIPDQSVIDRENGHKYEYLISTRGESYAFVYTYTGRNMHIKLGKISGTDVKAWWYNPRNGSLDYIGLFVNSGTMKFSPPEEKGEGKDWVLILEDSKKNYIEEKL